MVLLAVAPWLTETLAGLADNVNFGVCGALTVKLIVALLESDPLVPVMVTFAVPVAAVLEAVKVTVSVFAAEPAANVAVTPEGKPLALYVTVPENPPLGVTVRVLPALAP